MLGSTKQALLRRTRWAVTIMAMGLSSLAAAVDEQILRQADALLKAGKAEEAFQLLEPLEVVGAGESLYDYLLGTSALESGKPSKATFVYERILVIDPTYIGVRADMGRAYFALGDYGRAKIEFETVLTAQNLPLDLRGQVEQYVAAAEARSQAKRTVMTGYMEMGFGRDSNIGTATSQSSLNLPATGTYNPAAPAGLKTPDSYGTLAFGGEINHQLAEQWGAYVGADYRKRGHVTHTGPNNWTIDGRAGVSYSGGPWLLRSGVLAGAYYYNGARLRETVGLSADWRMALDQKSQVTAAGSISRSTYVPATSLDQQSDTYSGTIGWLTSLGDGTTVLNITGTGGYEDAFGNRSDGDRRFLGPRILVQKSFSDTLGGYVTSGITASRYKGINSSYLFARRETLTDLTLALTWTVAKGVSVRPQVSYTKNKSNAELYAYDKTDASINVRFDY